MVEIAKQDYTPSLQRLMQRVGVSSYKALSKAAGVSERQLLKLRHGKLQQMQVDVLLKLSQVLQVSLSELIATFSEVELGAKETALPEESQQALADLKREYERLQAQLTMQQQALLQEFQQSSLQAIESWLLQWPTAAQKARENPELAAIKLLPLVRPIEQLIQRWGVVAIAPVGAEVVYDPQLHQLFEGTAQPGEKVKVRYTGYRQGEKLLYRAKVSPISPISSLSVPKP